MRKVFINLAIIAVLCVGLVYYENRLQILSTLKNNTAVRAEQNDLLAFSNHYDDYIADRADALVSFSQLASINELIDNRISNDAIFALDSAIQEYILKFPEFSYFRFTDLEYSRILFSTHPADILEQDANRIKFIAINALEADYSKILAAHSIDTRDTSARIYLDTNNNALIYNVTLKLNGSGANEVMLYAFSNLDGLNSLFQTENLISRDEQILILQNGFFLNSKQTVQYDIAALTDVQNESIITFADNISYTVFTKNIAESLYLLHAIPSADTNVSALQKVAVFVIILFSLGILLLFIAQTRQSATIVIAERIKSFRKSVIKFTHNRDRSDGQIIFNKLLQNKKTIEQKALKGIKDSERSKRPLTEIFEEQWAHLLAGLSIAGIIPAGTRGGGVSQKDVFQEERQPRTIPRDTIEPLPLNDASKHTASDTPPELLANLDEELRSIDETDTDAAQNADDATRATGKRETDYRKLHPIPSARSDTTNKKGTPLKVESILNDEQDIDLTESNQLHGERRSGSKVLVFGVRTPKKSLLLRAGKIAHPQIIDSDTGLFSINQPVLTQQINTDKNRSLDDDFVALIENVS